VERLSGLPKATQGVSVSSQIRPAVSWSALPPWDAPCRALETSCKAFCDVLRRSCLETMVASAYFNIDLEDILQTLPRSEKGVFNGEKSRL